MFFIQSNYREMNHPVRLALSSVDKNACDSPIFRELLSIGFQIVFKFILDKTSIKATSMYTIYLYLEFAAKLCLGTLNCVSFYIPPSS